MNCEKYLNRKTLIVGDVNSGKTERTLKVLRGLLEWQRGPLAVLDLAPEKIRGVGGKIPLSPEERKRLSYLSPLIIPPRLLGKNPEEVLELARENRKRIDIALEDLKAEPPLILVINDVSLYLQTGKVENLKSLIGMIPTVIMNGYYGTYFPDGILTKAEKQQMEFLLSQCDQILFLSPLTVPSI